MDKKTGALQGLRVLDLGQVIAGNFCSVLLADFGADIIKIERPGVGDGLRYMGKTIDGISTGHMVDNRGKRCITLNLQEEKGREIFFELLKISDVVVENYAAGVMEKMGLGYDALKKVNPKIILARVSGFGQYGPKSGLSGYDRVGMAYGGITYLTGDPNGPPMRPGLGIADYMSGMFAALGVMFALYHRDAAGSGEGQMIDLGLYESVFRVMESTAVDYKLFGDIRNRVGNKHPLSVPGDHYLTKDGRWVTIASGNDKVFKKLAVAIGREDLLSDPRFVSHGERTKPENRAAIEEICKQWFAERDEKDCAAALEKDVPYSAILNIEDIFKEEHYRARENIIEVMQDTVGKIYMQGVVPKMTGTPGEVNWAGASLGAFNDEIFKGLLGMSDEKIAELKAESII